MSQSINHLFRLIWNETHQCWIPVAEISRTASHKTKSATVLSTVSLVALAASLSCSLQAAPIGGVVSSGSANINQAGSQTVITQHSNKASLNWQSFNINNGETVTFKQPNQQSLAVNRIADVNGTQIHGNLNANGQVWLINPNGVIFGESAQVNVGGIVASTLEHSKKNGTDNFSGDSLAKIINKGTINAADYAAFIAHQVSNEGLITARLGSIALAGGSDVNITFDDNRLLSVQVDKNKLNALAANHNLLVADGGQVIMNAGARDSLLASAVNNTGFISATTVENRDGKIILLGGMSTGTTSISGTLDVSAVEGDAGFIETSAANIDIDKTTTINTRAAKGKGGHWLIDPQDLVISAGSSQPGIDSNLINTALSMGDVSICTSDLSCNYGQAPTYGSVGAGNITISSNITWSTDTTLTLSADNNINVDADITPTIGKVIFNFPGTLTLNAQVTNGVVNGTGSSSIFKMEDSSQWSHTTSELLAFSVNDFQLNPNGTFNRFSGGDGTSSTPYTITDLYGLQGAASKAYKDSYMQVSNDIDATQTAQWNNDQGFQHIGNNDFVLDLVDNIFTGTFDGNSKNITGLIIDIPGVNSQMGMFGRVNNATIKNINLIDASISSQDDIVGGIVGRATGNSIIDNNRFTGTVVSGTSTAGAIVGILSSDNNNTIVSNNSSDVTVSGNSAAGGIIGSAYDSSNTFNVAIDGNYSEGSITGTGFVGGIIGYNGGGHITNNSSAADVILDYQSYPFRYAGGIIGDARANVNPSISGNLFTGNVSVINAPANTNANDTSVDVFDRYFLGSIAGRIRYNTELTNNYALQNNSQPLYGIDELYAGVIEENNVLLTSSQLTDIASYSNLSISPNGGGSSTWRIYQGHTAPLLRNFLTPLDLAATTTYNASAQTQPLAPSEALSEISGSYATGTNVGSYDADLWSTQLGYDISGGLTINAKPIDLQVSFADYSLGSPATIKSIGSQDIFSGDTVSFNYQTSYQPNSPGTVTAVANGITLTGIDALNYLLLKSQYSAVLDIPTQSNSFTTAKNDAQNIGTTDSQGNTGPEFLPQNQEGFGAATRPPINTDEQPLANNQGEGNSQDESPTQNVIFVEGGFAPRKLLNITNGGAKINGDNLVTGRLGIVTEQSENDG